MSRRTEQIGDEIQRILGEVIQNEVKDPRVGFATVTGVTVTPDLSRANVRISILGEDEERDETMRALQRARGFLRRRVGEEITLRNVPQLVLHLDTSLDHALRITELLHKIDEDRKTNPPILNDDEE